METSEPAAPLGEPILLRYDGLDAARHELEMADLAESLRGLARIIGVCGNLAVTHRFVQHRDALSVRVVVRPPRAHCFEVLAFVQWAGQHPYIAGTAATLTAGLVGYVFQWAAGKREEMRHLRGALDTAIKELGTRDQVAVDRLLSTIDKMAESLRPATKQAVAPIASTASSITISDGSGRYKETIGEAEKAAITTEVESVVDMEKIYKIRISELDLETGKCKIRMHDEPLLRFDGRITDPALQMPNNDYVLAMAAHKEIRVTGKAVLRDGNIAEVYISNVV